MKCPFCKEEMRVGSISQDRYALKWVPDDRDRGLLNFTPLVKGIKLTSIDAGKYSIVKHAGNLSLTRMICVKH